MKFLIVEDDDACMLVLTYTLKSLGYNQDDFILTEITGWIPLNCSKKIKMIFFVC